MSDDDPVVDTATADSQERLESLALLKVVRLAPTLEVAEALLRGQRVPRERLDPDWLRRYGLEDS